MPQISKLGPIRVQELCWYNFIEEHCMPMPKRAHARPWQDPIFSSVLRVWDVNSSTVPSIPSGRLRCPPQCFPHQSRRPFSAGLQALAGLLDDNARDSQRRTALRQLKGKENHVAGLT